jgi:4-aminobutyrate aminotransferase/(S)-3-amino-2-methylpropionate transaminase
MCYNLAIYRQYFIRAWSTACGSIINATKSNFLQRRQRRSNGLHPSSEELQSCLYNKPPGSPKLAVLSFFGGLHGRTLAALSCTHTRTRFKMDFTAFDWPVAPFPLIKYPLRKYREYNKEEEAKCLEKTRHLLKKRNESGTFVVAVIVEPIQSEGGDMHASPEFFKGLQLICKENDAFFIVDEIQTGGGPTGQMWYI